MIDASIEPERASRTCLHSFLVKPVSSAHAARMSVLDMAVVTGFGICGKGFLLIDGWERFTRQNRGRQLRGKAGGMCWPKLPKVAGARRPLSEARTISLPVQSLRRVVLGTGSAGPQSVGSPALFHAFFSHARSYATAAAGAAPTSTSSTAGDGPPCCCCCSAAVDHVSPPSALTCECTIRKMKPMYSSTQTPHA